MGGGGAFRTAAKVAGATVANGAFRSVTAENPVRSAALNVVRPVSVSAISDDVKSSALVAACDGGAVDVSPVQRTSWEFDDWEIAGGEEKLIVKSGEPLPRVVFGGAPSLHEAKEATSDLKDALEKVYLLQPANESGGSFRSVKGSSLSSFSKACIVSETTVAPSASKHAMQAFRFLNESPAAQTVVASIASDPNVWNAVLQNPALQDFLEVHKTSESISSTDQKIEESVADAEFVSQSSPRSMDAKFEEEVPESGNAFTGFLENIKQTVVDMMNSLSDYFNKLFGGNSVSVDSDGNVKLSIDKTLGASFMGLAIMAIMVVVLKRS